MKSADKKQTQMNGQDRMKVCRALNPEKMQGLASPEFPCRTLMIRTSCDNFTYEDKAYLSKLTEEWEAYILINQTKLVRQTWETVKMWDNF